MRTPPTQIHRPHRARRGFNLLEMLIALALTAALMAATMVALDASFMAYQTTTELASTHTASSVGPPVRNQHQEIQHIDEVVAVQVGAAIL